MTIDRAFYLQAENYADKEGWIGALGKAMIRPGVMKGDDEYFEED